MKISSFLSNSSLMMLTAIILVLVIGGFPHGFPISNGNISMISENHVESLLLLKLI